VDRRRENGGVLDEEGRRAAEDLGALDAEHAAVELVLGLVEGEQAVTLFPEDRPVGGQGGPFAV
jgi:hypothetical protein